MPGYVDIHTHLLPGVDDGCDDVTESLELARRMVDAGIGDVCCTPHIQPPMPQNNRRQIAKNVAKLRDAIDAADIPLRIHAGGENRVGKENLDRPARDRVLLADFNSRGGDLGEMFFLFDDWGHRRPRILEPMANRLVAEGITPILAHPERTPWFWRKPLETADWLAGLGVRLQLNVYTLAGEQRGSIHVSREMVETAETLLESGRYDFLATDSHHVDTWPPRAVALKLARQRMGDALFDRLFRENPTQVLPA